MMGEKIRKEMYIPPISMEKITSDVFKVIKLNCTKPHKEAWKKAFSFFMIPDTTKQLTCFFNMN